MQRPDGRTKGAMRPVKITTDYTMYAEGSVLVEMGNTKVICTASVEEKVPPFLEGKGLGWVTAEYAMLPRATNTRKKRDIKSLKLDGRASEIQRLIGRALRAVVDREALGERQITIDCDVIQADGGTDMLLSFDKIWRAPDEIARLASLAVCARENEDWDALREKAAALKDSLGATVELVQGDSLTISSTELRQGGALRCYTPESVADYIEEKHLYGY